MANFILPNEYFYGNLNNHLVDLKLGQPNLFKNKIDFIGVHANLPFSIWNGGTLINDRFLNKIEIENLYKETIKPLFIDCSNIFISSTDLFNLKENIFLEKYHTGLNYIIISDPNLLTLLKAKFPYYSYVLSPYLPQEEITDELINKCSYIMNYYDNINLEIPKNKVIIILPINENCYNCSDFFYCSRQEQENIYNFKTESRFRNCKYNSTYTLYIWKYERFIEQGYTNFTFDDRSFPLNNQKLMSHFYADFFGAENKNQDIFNLLIGE